MLPESLTQRFSSSKLLMAAATLLLSSSLTSNAHSADKAELKPFSAEYKAEVSGFSGSGSRSLTKEGDDWVLKFGAEASIVIASISIDETSRVAIKNGQVEPLQYVYERKGIGGKPAKVANFDWNAMTASWAQADKKSSIKFKKGSQDPLSYQLNLRMDLKAGKKDLAYPVVDDDEVYERKFIIEGEEELNTKAGKLKTVKVKIVRDDNDRQTWIWFAKDWDYVLVQFLQKEKDSDYLIKFDSGTLEGKTIKGI